MYIYTLRQSVDKLILWMKGILVIRVLQLESPCWIFISVHFNNTLCHDKIKSSLFNKFKSLIYASLQCQYWINISLNKEFKNTQKRSQYYFLNYSQLHPSKIIELSASLQPIYSSTTSFLLCLMREKNANIH